MVGCRKTRSDKRQPPGSQADILTEAAARVMAGRASLANALLACGVDPGDDPRLAANAYEAACLQRAEVAVPPTGRRRFNESWTLRAMRSVSRRMRIMP